MSVPTFTSEPGQIIELQRQQMEAAKKMGTAELLQYLVRKQQDKIDGIVPELREEPWFHFVLPYEEPKLFRGRGKWRHRHERIFRLEQSLGIIDDRWRDYSVLPWVKLDLGW